jgi:hypothetical protein
MTQPRKCSTCKHFTVIAGDDEKHNWGITWGTCTKPGQTMTEEAAASQGYPCWEAKE